MVMVMILKMAKMEMTTPYPPQRNSPYMKVDNDNDGDDGYDYGKFRLSLKLDFDCNHDSVSASMKSGLPERDLERI